MNWFAFLLVVIIGSINLVSIVSCLILREKYITDWTVFNCSVDAMQCDVAPNLRYLEGIMCCAVAVYHTEGETPASGKSRIYNCGWNCHLAHHLHPTTASQMETAKEKIWFSTIISKDCPLTWLVCQDIYHLYLAEAR